MKTTMPKKESRVLFICKGNWFRSQMAAAIFNKLTNSKLADSAGTYVGAIDEPEGQVLSDLFEAPHFFEVMEKNGVNIRNNITKRLEESMLNNYDIIISMAEEPFIPDFLKKAEKVIWWNIENSSAVNQKIAEDTYIKVERLVQSLIMDYK